MPRSGSKSEHLNTAMASVAALLVQWEPYPHPSTPSEAFLSVCETMADFLSFNKNVTPDVDSMIKEPKGEAEKKEIRC